VILFLDSSALVKLYVEEPESDLVHDAAKNAAWIAVSSLAFAETTAAITHKKTRKKLSELDALKAIKNLSDTWFNFSRYLVNERLTQRAGIIARTHCLSGADAVQLATAQILQEEERNVYFLAYDHKLNVAAERIVRLWAADI
jgi:uncharacterized protein